MLKYCMYCLLLLPLSAQAFDFEKLKKMAENPELMQQEAEKFAKGMMEASGCIKSESLEKMQAEGQAMQNEIKTLCAKGDRSKAEKVALKYSRQIISSNEYKELKECGDKFMSYLPPGVMEEIKTQAEAEPDTNERASSSHICDNI